MFTVYIGTDAYNEVVKVEFTVTPAMSAYLNTATVHMTFEDGWQQNVNILSVTQVHIETNHTNELPGEEQVADDLRGKYYDDGFRAGRADRSLGLPMLIMARTSHLPGYADGYRSGYHSRGG